MFERYTEKARRVIFYSRYEASVYGSPYIETEHILLGFLREEKELGHRLIPRAHYETIRQQVSTRTPKRPATATSVDLLLSNESKRVLTYAAEEADGLSHRHIGSEHLLLGLLREERSFAAQLLREFGASLEDLRLKIQKLPEPWDKTPNYPILPEKSRPKPTIEIHGSQWDVEYIRNAVARCRQHSWHWNKRSWTSRDIAIERATGRVSFDLGLADDAANFELVRGGWKKDQCAICRWELFESQDDAEHGLGYTNGRDWVCSECYEKFLGRTDFFASSHPEIT